jgi:hypothetical protein
MADFAAFGLLSKTLSVVNRDPTLPKLKFLSLMA